MCNDYTIKINFGVCLILPNNAFSILRQHNFMNVMFSNAGLNAHFILSLHVLKDISLELTKLCIWK